MENHLLLRLPCSRAFTLTRNTPKTQTTETLPNCILKTVDEDTVRFESPMVHRAQWTDLVAVPHSTEVVFHRPKAFRVLWDCYGTVN